jgi:2-dehydropantoate 2-reductase
MLNPWTRFPEEGLTRPVRIGIVGAGAVGGWVGGHLARAGLDITLIDPWPNHVAAIRSGGIVLTEPGNEYRVPVKALHVGEVQSLYAMPLDLAFVCMKLYDTDWAIALIAPYLASSGFVVTLQNGLIEERVAAVVGWGRTVGCIAGGLYVGLAGPGHVVRARHPAQGFHKVFRVGEVHGRITPRVLSVAEMLGHVDGAEATSNLWGARWSKLTANAMTSGLCAASGLNLRQLYLDPVGQKIMARLGGEAVAVGLALGFAIEDIFGLAAERWVAAAAGDPAALAEARASLQGQTVDMGENALSGIAQDLAKGRRTEIEYLNGYIATKAGETGTAAPIHSSVASLIRKMERGTTKPRREAMDDLLAAAERRDAGPS